MPASFVLENAARDVLSDALKAYLDDGVLEILDGATLLVTFTIPDQAVMTSVNGLITIGALGPENATGTGTADTAKYYTNAKGALVATGNVATAAATVILDNTSINTGQAVNITSATITVPSGA
jgi:hypothetical protein